MPTDLRTRRGKRNPSPVSGPVETPPQQRQTKVTVSVDKPLLYTTLALCFMGLAAVFSASAPEAMDTYGNSLYYVQKQFIYFIMGFVLMMGVSRFSFFSWQRLAVPVALVVIGLLAYTLMNGVEAYGAERWIRIMGFQFQPSELGKISVVLLLAQALVHPVKPGSFFRSLPNWFLIVLTLGLIIKQPSLSMTIILSVVTAGLMFIAGWPKKILIPAGIAAFAGLVYKISNTEYQMRRIQGWLDPWKDAQDTGYNLIQSLYAIGSGGLFGAGLGMSHQKLHWLPFRHTDFIFSVWAEEWGLLGCIVLIGVFLLLLYRGLVIAQSCRSAFGQLVAMGITMVLAVQIIINICVATGLFPVTGVTLPLISYGGTSVLVTMTMIGILLNISRYRTNISTISQKTAA